MTKKLKMKASRRAFLSASALAGGAAAMFPWLNATAQGTPNKKLVLIYFPHGTVRDQWLPTGSETDFELSPILSPLESRKNDLIIVDGLNIRDVYNYRVPHTHDMPMVWTGSPLDEESSLFFRMHGENPVNYGWNRSKSVDQEVASRLMPTTAFPTLELGVRSGNSSEPRTRMIYSAPGEPKNPIPNAPAAFDQVFGGFTGPDVDLDELRQRSVLDAVSQDLTRISSGLSARDRERLDNHASAIREIEQSLGGTLTCTTPERPMGGGGDGAAIDAQFDLLVAALACGRTNIASFQLSIADNDGSEYGGGFGLTGGHHIITHMNTPTALGDLSSLYTWYMERLERLLTNMANTPDGEGTSLLDNSVVVVSSEIGRGNHNLSNIPVLVAGGGGGTLRGGRFLSVSGAHNRLLVSTLHAMGIADVDAFGVNDEGAGPVPGLVG